mmetsp:Transcript_36753/g.75341  ORF Transcript_36753/g.75341 Transcript_36753/m.75341 type:complete len:85 (+) Transcript_36753:174-428(+)
MYCIAASVIAAKHQSGRDCLSETLHAELDPLQQQQINQVLQPRPGLRKRAEVALALTVEEHRKLALESLKTTPRRPEETVRLQS